MRRTLPFFRLLYRLVWWTGVSLIVAFGVVVAVARLGLPVVSEYRLEVQERLHRELGINLSIGAVEADWHGMYPELRVTDLTVLDEQGQPTGVRFERMRITLNLWASWLHWRLQPQDLELGGIRLWVSRDREGRLSVRGWPSSGVTDWSRTLDWVLQHRLIKFTDARVSLHDQGNGLRFAIDDASLYLLTIGEGHRLTASATLAPHSEAGPDTHLFARLTMAADLVGGGSRFSQGSVYLAAEEVELDQPEISWLPKIEGQSFKLWAQRVNNQWSTVEGELRGLVLRATRDSRPLRLQDSALKAHADSGVWRTVAGPLLTTKPGDGTRIWLDWTLDSARSPALDIRVDRVQAQALGTLLASNTRIPAKIREGLRAMAPNGELTAAHFVKSAGEDSFAFTTRFSRLFSRYWRGIPTLSGISGGVSIDSDSGRVTLDAGGGRIAMGPMFSSAWPLDRLQADLGFEISDEQWRVRLREVSLENRDLAVEAKGEILAPRGGGAPYLDLVGVYYRGKGESLGLYMPLQGLSTNAREWLEKSVVSGEVTGGALVFRGWTDQFPFPESEGKFETSFDVVDAVVDYADNWPRLEGVDAEVEFRQQDMAIHAVGGHILDAEMRGVEIALPGLLRPNRTVFLDGELDLEVSEVREFILDSPLVERYKPFVDSLAAKGDGSLHMKLELPLDHPEQNKVSGALQMRGTDLHWKQSGLLLEKVNGTLSFDLDGLRGSNIRAQVLGQSARVDVGTGNDGGKAITFIKLSGALDKALLQTVLGKQTARFMRGKSNWQATIKLPQKPGGRLQPRVQFDSSLKGLAVNLPSPLNKKAATALDLQIATRLGDSKQRKVQFRYGDRLGGEVEIDLANKSPIRGVLRFGPGKIVLPAKKHLKVHGRLRRLPLDDWLDVLDKTAGKGSGQDTADMGWLQRLKDVDIHVGRLDLFGQRYSDLTAKASHRKKNWIITLDGDEIKGNIVLPDSRSRTLSLNLGRLYMRPAGGETGERPPDPRKLPPMDIRVKEFRFDGLALGSLELVADRSHAGLTLKTLGLKSPLLTVTASGLWEVRKGQQYSECDVNFSADSLGKMFQQLGYAKTIKGGTTKGHISAHWSGPPTNFALGRLRGNFEIDIGSGSLLQIDPGAGRIFGLLSPQAFTQKLAKDYAKLAKKGFYFDTISGEYRLEGGNAYTESLNVNGPVARIEISGRIGLLARDYNQYVEVIPRVSSGLTLASGALAIGSPPLGAALLLAQTVFGEKLDTIGSRYYLISGGWDDPQVTRLKRPRGGNR